MADLSIHMMLLNDVRHSLQPIATTMENLQHLNISSSRILHAVDLVDIIHQRSHSLQTLGLQSIGLGSESELFTDTLAAILPDMQGLRSIVFKFPDRRTLPMRIMAVMAAGLAKCPRITCTNINISMNPFLELNGENPEWGCMAAALPRLRSLVIGSYMGWTQNHVEALVRNFHYVEALEVRDNETQFQERAASKEWLTAVATLPCLTSLSLYRCNFIDDDDLECLQRATSLTQLTIKKCPAALTTEASVLALCRSLPCLAKFYNDRFP